MAGIDKTGVEEGRKDRKRPGQEIIEHKKGSQIPGFRPGHPGNNTVTLQKLDKNLEESKITGQFHRFEKLLKSSQLFLTLQRQLIDKIDFRTEHFLRELGIRAV